MPKKTVKPDESGPVAESVANVTHEQVTEEVVETRNGFSLFRKGEVYVVKNPEGVAIAPFTSKDDAEQLFRNMSRKF